MSRPSWLSEGRRPQNRAKVCIRSVRARASTKGTDHLNVKSGCSLALALMLWLSRCFWLFVFFWRFLSGSWSWYGVLALPRSVRLFFLRVTTLEPFFSWAPVPVERGQLWRSGNLRMTTKTFCPLCSSSALEVQRRACIATKGLIVHLRFRLFLRASCYYSSRTSCARLQVMLTCFLLNPSA